MFNNYFNQTYYWGLGIGDWGLGPIPNPQSPNPQSPNYLNNVNLINNLIEYLIKL